MVLPANMGPMMTWTSPEGIEGLKEAMMDLGLERGKGFEIRDSKEREDGKRKAFMARINREEEKI